MPGLDILKDWENLKKQGLPALIVAIVWAVTELFSTFGPKDKTCTDEVKYFQTELTAERRWKDSAFYLKLQLTQSEKDKKSQDTIINAYRLKVTEPAKEILKKYYHDQKNN